MDHFGPKNGASSLLWIRSRIFFLILHIKRGEHLHEIIIIFPKKFYWQMSYFVPEIDTS